MQRCCIVGGDAANYPWTRDMSLSKQTLVSTSFNKHITWADSGFSPMSTCIAKCFSPNRVLTLTSSEQRCLGYLQPRSISAFGVRRKPLELYLGDLTLYRPPHSQPASSGPSNAWRNPSPPFQSAASEVHSPSLD